MPTIKRRSNVAAVTTNTNVLQGDQYEFVERPSQVEIYASTDDFANQRVTVFFGDRLLGRDMVINAESTATAGSVNIQTDQVLSEVILPRERLVIQHQNLHATLARNVNFLIKITPIA